MYTDPSKCERVITLPPNDSLFITLLFQRSRINNNVGIRKLDSIINLVSNILMTNNRIVLSNYKYF